MDVINIYFAFTEKQAISLNGTLSVNDKQKIHQLTTRGIQKNKILQVLNDSRTVGRRVWMSHESFFYLHLISVSQLFQTFLSQRALLDFHLLYWKSFREKFDVLGNFNNGLHKIVKLGFVESLSEIKINLRYRMFSFWFRLKKWTYCLSNRYNLIVKKLNLNL